MALLNCFHIFYRYYICDKMFMSWNFCVQDNPIYIYALKLPPCTLVEMLWPHDPPPPTLFSYFTYFLNIHYFHAKEHQYSNK